MLVYNSDGVLIDLSNRVRGYWEYLSIQTANLMYTFSHSFFKHVSILIDSFCISQNDISTSLFLSLSFSLSRCFTTIYLIQNLFKHHLAAYFFDKMIRHVRSLNHVLSQMICTAMQNFTFARSKQDKHWHKTVKTSCKFSYIKYNFF